MADQGELFGGPKEACIFCRIRDREAPGWIVHEDDDVFAFLDHRPLLRGHTLVTPKPHVDTLLDLDPVAVGPLFVTVQTVARAVERALEADGAFVAVNVRVSQSVPHLHVHVVPRWRRDGLFGRKLVWFRRGYRSKTEAVATQRAIADSIRALLAESVVGG